MAVKLTRADVESATEILKRTIADLSDRGVKAFKGTLLGPDSQPMWSIEVSFERKQQKRSGDGEG